MRVFSWLRQSLMRARLRFSISGFRVFRSSEASFLMATVLAPRGGKDTAGVILGSCEDLTFACEQRFLPEQRSARAIYPRSPRHGTAHHKPRARVNAKVLRRRTIGWRLKICARDHLLLIYVSIRFSTLLFVYNSASMLQTDIKHF